MAEEKLVCDYDRLFDPEVYLKTYYGGLSSQEDLMPFLFKGLHSAFANGKLHGTRLLDLGTGPSICSVISAVPHFQEIYLTDYSDRNRHSLQQWLSGSTGHSFQAFFEFFLNLEGKQSSWIDGEEELRRKVKSVLKCDVLQSRMLENDNLGQVDVITSSLCLEAAATDVACYGEICKRIAALLRDGGHVVLVGVLEQTFYIVGGHRFYSLFINKEDLIKAWENAGFSIVSFSEKKTVPVEENPFSDCKAGFCLVARKNKA